MATAFQFELVSPESLLVSGQVTEVLVPGEEGYFTVMANHAPTMSTLQPGVAEVSNDNGDVTKYVIFGGFIDVTPEACTLLAEAAVSVKDINEADLDQRIADAREDVNDAKSDASKAKAESYLDRLTVLKTAVING